MERAKFISIQSENRKYISVDNSVNAVQPAQLKFCIEYRSGQ